MLQQEKMLSLQDYVIRNLNLNYNALDSHTILLSYGNNKFTAHKYNFIILRPMQCPTHTLLKSSTLMLDIQVFSS